MKISLYLMFSNLIAIADSSVCYTDRFGHVDLTCWFAVSI